MAVALGDGCTSHRTIKNWSKDLKESLEDDPREGGSVTAITPKKYCNILFQFNR